MFTHNHQDHEGGIGTVKKNTDNKFSYVSSTLFNKYQNSIGKLYIKTYDGSSKSSTQKEKLTFWYNEILKQFKSQNIPISYIDKDFKDGGQITFGDMKIKLYNTQHSYLGVSTRTDNDNSNSVLELIDVNNYKVLLTGDFYSTYINRRLMVDLSKKSEFKNLDVLKMPHHGYGSCAFQKGTNTSQTGWNFGPTAANNLKPKNIIVTNDRANGHSCGDNSSALSDKYVNTWYLTDKIKLDSSSTSTKAIVVDLAKGKLNISISK